MLKGYLKYDTYLKKNAIFEKIKLKKKKNYLFY